MLSLRKILKRALLKLMEPDDIVTDHRRNFGKYSRNYNPYKNKRY